tara:strand:- start:117 stop:533 length:417 start_codon:yes stop_codon:yes gene_type:complete
MASKKKKSVKKYAVGGDLRKSINPNEQMTSYTGTAAELYGGPIGAFPEPGYGSGGAGHDDTATGQVRQISASARRAANQLSQAGLAQQHAGSMLGNAGPFAPLTNDELGDYKKGGKVKKSAKTSVKVRGSGLARRKRG